MWAAKLSGEAKASELLLHRQASARVRRVQGGANGVDNRRILRERRQLLRVGRGDHGGAKGR
jgi:hypothetical protein